MRDYIGPYYRAYRGDARSLDCSSNGSASAKWKKSTAEP